jgi:hypothetical protein
MARQAKLIKWLRLEPGLPWDSVRRSCNNFVTAPVVPGLGVALGLR